MKIFTKTLLALSFAMPLSLVTFGVNAEETAAVTASASASSEIVSRIEKALVEIDKTDYSAAQVQLKAARTLSDSIADSSAAAKKAHAQLIQGQIFSKNGNSSKATEELNKAIALFKAI